MKNLLYIVLFFSQIVFSQDAFDEGNQLYVQKKYAEAVQQYESILKGGEESAEVYFNLGNAYYQLKKVGPAIYNYEKALQLNPGDRDILVNLGFAQKLAVDDIKAMPRTGISKLVYNWAGNFHYDSWAWAAVAFAFVSVLLFIGYYFTVKPASKQGFFGGMIVALLLMIICTGFAFFVRSEAAGERPAIVFAKSVTLKETPESGAADGFSIHEGAKVYVVQEKGDKVKVQLADDTAGWLDKNTIKEL
jgi:tetratricopeptide (TPR) repeat protein